MAERERGSRPSSGAGDVLALYRRFGYDPVGLAAGTERFLDDTEALYLGELERLLADVVGVPLAHAGPQDVARLLRAPDYDVGFPGERALPALRATLAGWASTSTPSAT